MGVTRGILTQEGKNLQAFETKARDKFFFKSSPE
jgi:hypothetical protein